MLISGGGGSDTALADPVTLTFNLLTSNKTGDQHLSCTAHLPSLVMLGPVVFGLDTYILNHICTELLNAMFNPATMSA